MSEKRIPNVKRAIQQLKLEQLLILAREMQVQYEDLQLSKTEGLSVTLPVFDNAVRHALSVAFSVPNGAIKPQVKRPIKSPVVRSFLERDTTSQNPEVVARDGMTFTEGAETVKF